MMSRIKIFILRMQCLKNFSQALRTQEGSEAQVCFFIIQLLLFKGAEFRARVQEFVKENSPDHWKQSNWFAKPI